MGKVSARFPRPRPLRTVFLARPAVTGMGAGEGSGKEFRVVEDRRVIKVAKPPQRELAV